jgi:hypothetical protein
LGRDGLFRVAQITQQALGAGAAVIVAAELAADRRKRAEGPGKVGADGRFHDTRWNAPKTLIFD